MCVYIYIYKQNDTIIRKDERNKAITIPENKWRDCSVLTIWSHSYDVVAEFSSSNFKDIINVNSVA